MIDHTYKTGESTKKFFGLLLWIISSCFRILDERSFSGPLSITFWISDSSDIFDLINELSSMRV